MTGHDFGDDGREGSPPTRLALAWSGGKDAAFALHALRGDPAVEVARLFTIVDADADRVRAHRVRPALVERQAAALDLPMDRIDLPADAANETYEAALAERFADYADRGIYRVGYADLHLADVREYRESLLAATPVEGVWPLWGRDTGALAREFLDPGFRATVVAVRGDALDPSFAGREFDREFLADLPDGVDPCGENGEFHTFVRDGPGFESPVSVEVGDPTTDEGHGGTYHCRDLRPA